MGGVSLGLNGLSPRRDVTKSVTNALNSLYICSRLGFRLFHTTDTLAVRLMVTAVRPIEDFHLKISMTAREHHKNSLPPQRQAVSNNHISWSYLLIMKVSKLSRRLATNAAMLLFSDTPSPYLSITKATESPTGEPSSVSRTVTY